MNADVLGERACAALAELGYGAFYRVVERPTSPGWFVPSIYSKAPIEVLWKAYVVSGSELTACLACYKWESLKRFLLLAPCLDRGRGLLDCGVER